MKLSELKSRVGALRDERALLHVNLSELLADKTICVGEREEAEEEIREQIVAINAECYPKEVVMSKLLKIAKGQELKLEEQKLFDECLELVGEEITFA